MILIIRGYSSQAPLQLKQSIDNKLIIYYVNTNIMKAKQQIEFYKKLTINLYNDLQCLSAPTQSKQWHRVEWLVAFLSHRKHIWETTEIWQSHELSLWQQQFAILSILHL